MAMPAKKIVLLYDFSDALTLSPTVTLWSQYAYLASAMVDPIRVPILMTIGHIICYI